MSDKVERLRAVTRKNFLTGETCPDELPNLAAAEVERLRALASGPTITLTLDEVRALYKFLPGAPGCIAQEAAI